MRKEYPYAAAHALASLQLHSAVDVMWQINLLARQAERAGQPGPVPMPLSPRLLDQVEMADMLLRCEISAMHLERLWASEIMSAAHRLLSPERLPLAPLFVALAGADAPAKPTTFMHGFGDVVGLLRPVMPRSRQPEAVPVAEEAAETAHAHVEEEPPPPPKG